MRNMTERIPFAATLLLLWSTLTNVSCFDLNQTIWEQNDDDGNDMSASSSKPNILLIMADDVGTGDIPFYWNSGLVEMPNIQRLIDAGVTFKRAHSTPLCAPSRYALLSGNYQHRGAIPGGAWNLNSDQNQFVKTQKSIAWVLKNWAGYRTMMTGKWHIGAKIPRKGSGELDKVNYLSSPTHDWSRPLIQGPQDIGFDYSYITTSGIQNKPYSFFRNGYLTTKPSDIVWWNKGTYKKSGFKGESIVKRPGEGDRNWDSTAYNQIIVEETIDFIDDHLQNYPDKPFFAYTALGAVHGPHSPPDKYLDGTPIKGEYPTPHMDMLLEMDKAVGSLIDAIDERDLTSNTVIIFASDNGGVMPANDSTEFNHYSSGPLRGAKGDIYEGGTRIPLVFSYKGTFPAKQTRNHYVSLNDIYATLCDLAGTVPPDDSAQDSVSFADYLYSESNTADLRKWLPTWTYDPETGFRTAEAMIYKNLKGIRLINIETSERTWELYDLDKDVSETNNITKDPQYKKMKRKMFRRLTLTGPCPNRDRKKAFILRNGPMKGQSVTCDFFDLKERCEVYIDGERFCQSKCSRREWICSR